MTSLTDAIKYKNAKDVRRVCVTSYSFRYRQTPIQTRLEENRPTSISDTDVAYLYVEI